MGRFYSKYQVSLKSDRYIIWPSKGESTNNALTSTVDRNTQLRWHDMERRENKETSYPAAEPRWMTTHDLFGHMTDANNKRGYTLISITSSPSPLGPIKLILQKAGKCIKILFASNYFIYSNIISFENSEILSFQIICKYNCRALLFTITSCLYIIFDYIWEIENGAYADIAWFKQSMESGNSWEDNRCFISFKLNINLQEIAQRALWLYYS